MNDADLQVNVLFEDDFNGSILLGKAVGQYPDCVSVKNIEDGEIYQITVNSTCKGNKIRFIAKDAVTLTDEGYRVYVYVETDSSAEPIRHLLLLYESHELLNFAIPTVDSLSADERSFSNLENADGRFILRWHDTNEIMAAFTDTMQQKERQAKIVGSSALLGAGLGTLLSVVLALFSRRSVT